MSESGPKPVSLEEKVPALLTALDCWRVSEIYLRVKIS
jgi:hypothetical protein